PGEGPAGRDRGRDPRVAGPGGAGLHRGAPRRQAGRGRGRPRGSVPVVKRANETLVGAAVLGALAMLVAGSIWLNQLRLGGFDQLAGARFRTIGGIKNGSPVLMRGVRIGRVLSVSLGERNWVNVQLAIRADTKVPPHPVAIIASTTLFGDWAVDISTRDNL